MILPTPSFGMTPRKGWTASWNSSLAKYGLHSHTTTGVATFQATSSLVVHAHAHTHTQVDSYTRPLIELVEEAVEKYSGNRGRAINFTCGPGLFSFLLTKTFQQVRKKMVVLKLMAPSIKLLVYIL